MEDMNTPMSTDAKSDKFKQLGTLRTQKVLKAIEGLSRLSNRSSYEYTEEQVDYIFNAINKALLEAKEHFTAKESASETFRL